MHINFRSNKIIKSCGTTLLSLFFMVSVPLSPSLAQEKGKLDVTTYTVPRGFENQSGGNTKSRAFLKKYSEDKFALLTLYSSINSFGDAKTDFSQRWQQVFGSIAQTKTLPKTESSKSGSISIVTGGDGIKYEGISAIGVLTTLTINGRLITIAGIVNDKQGAADYQSFVESLNLDDSLISQAPGSSAKPLASPKNPNIARSQSIGRQSIVGRWRHYIYSGGYYVPGAGTGYSVARNENAVIDYTFNSNGTFKVSLPRSNAGSGTYQATGNTLKLTYSNGTVKQYSYTFEERPETIYRYLILTEVGAAESFPRLQSEGNK